MVSNTKPSYLGVACTRLEAHNTGRQNPTRMACRPNIKKVNHDATLRPMRTQRHRKSMATHQQRPPSPLPTPRQPTRPHRLRNHLPPHHEHHPLTPPGTRPPYIDHPHTPRAVNHLHPLAPSTPAHTQATATTEGTHARGTATTPAAH